ncbi:MAG TPA: DUF5715 family protein [Patescibacteria group bacterium]|nr:DUF5715 family protein [Patescibacteria group bacterium]
MKRIFVCVLFALLVMASPVEAGSSPNHAHRSQTVTQKIRHHRTHETPRLAGAPTNTFMRFLSNVLVALKKTTLGTMDALRVIYGDVRQALEFHTYRDLRKAVESGTLVRIKSPERFNIDFRTTGRGRIGEADRVRGHNLSYYEAARKSVAGAMIEISGLVHAGPVEITSVTRTDAYQKSLSTRNGNAQTDFPTHAMGIAFDIGLLRSNPATVNEIVAAAKTLKAQGEIMFIAETASKCIHVVVLPAYKAHFESVYDQSNAEVAQ